MRVFALLAFLALPATAYTPEELLRPREIEVKCDKGVCQMSQDDAQFLMEQNQLLGRIVIRLMQRLQDCSGGKST